VTDRTN